MIEANGSSGGPEDGGPGWSNSMMAKGLTIRRVKETRRIGRIGIDFSLVERKVKCDRGRRRRRICPA